MINWLIAQIRSERVVSNNSSSQRVSPNTCILESTCSNRTVREGLLVFLQELLQVDLLFINLSENNLRFRMHMPQPIYLLAARRQIIYFPSENMHDVILKTEWFQMDWHKNNITWIIFWFGLNHVKFGLHKIFQFSDFWAELIIINYFEKLLAAKAISVRRFGQALVVNDIIGR